jgi:hypothetical protein
MDQSDAKGIRSYRRRVRDTEKLTWGYVMDGISQRKASNITLRLLSKKTIKLGYHVQSMSIKLEISMHAPFFSPYP